MTKNVNLKSSYLKLKETDKTNLNFFFKQHMPINSDKTFDIKQNLCFLASFSEVINNVTLL